MYRCTQAEIPELLVALKHQNPEICKRSVILLGVLGCEVALPQLLEIIKHPDSFVRAAAAGALALIGSESVVYDLLEAFWDPEPYVRGEVSMALGWIGAKTDKTVPRLIEALSHPENHSVRAKIVQALGRIGSRSIFPELLELLKDPDNYVLRSTVDALMMIDAEAAISELLPFLSAPDPRIREEIAKQLSSILRFSTNQSNEVITGVAEALRVKGQEIVSSFRQALKDTNPKVRESAAHALVLQWQLCR